MKFFALLVALVLVSVSGIAQAAPSAETLTILKLVKAFGSKYAVSGIQADGSAIECVAGIANAPLARTTAGNRARATLAFAQSDASVRQVIKNLGGKVLNETSVTAESSLIGIDGFKEEGGIVCARAKPIE